MQTRFAVSPHEAAGMATAELRSHFLVEDLFQPGKVMLVYTHYDRMIIGGVMPDGGPVELSNPEELKAAFFLERRELGIINVGGEGTVRAEGTAYHLNKLDCLYIGKGVGEVDFSSTDAGNPAKFYLLSAPAHRLCPIATLSREQASPVALGSVDSANRRTVYKYIHLEGIESCQLVMGLTVLEPGSVWNSLPPHTHTRRMEVYFYFDLAPEQRIFHFMGEPSSTKHLVVANNSAVISPPWGTHFGAGTSNYGFIWGMAGENLVYSDMDPAPVPSLL